MKYNFKLLRDLTLCIQLLRKSLNENDLGELHKTRIEFVLKKLENIYDIISGEE
jgi:hypothetical protein